MIDRQHIEKKTQLLTKAIPNKGFGGKLKDNANNKNK